MQGRQHSGVSDTVGSERHVCLQYEENSLDGEEGMTFQALG